MAWYYIDGAGTTLGPVEENVLAAKWKSSEITKETYVWNGTSVNQWSLVKDCPSLLKKIDKKPAAPSGGTRAAAPKRPKMGGMGGGRGSLLDSIRAGKALKKNTAPKPVASSGGSAKPKGGKMSLQEQLAMRLKKSSGGNKGGSANKSVRQPAKKTNPKPKPAANKFGNKKQPSANRGTGGGKVDKKQLKNKIDRCNEDWVLKAIQKLLD